MATIGEERVHSGTTSSASGLEAQLQARMALERRRLLEEAGLDERARLPYRRPVERPVTRDERDEVTFLFGGLTPRHEHVIQAAVQGLGYRVEVLPTPTKSDFQTGREFGNNGQCNPVHFTAGALVNYLRRLRDERGLSTEHILDHYAYVTAGSCGPCRFGMYEAEYRLVLCNSGFDGFRVIVFQQRGLEQIAETGIDLTPPFFLAVATGILIGDVINELAHRIRPYEVEPGQTDRAFGEAAEPLLDTLRRKKQSRFGRWLGSAIPGLTPAEGESLVDLLWNRDLLTALRAFAASVNRAIEVDYTRPKPLCKIAGEFWAQTTDGDGNFNMFPFLEAQGAEVWVEPVTTWVAYLLGQARAQLIDAKGLDPKTGRPLPRLRYWKDRFRLGLALRLLYWQYNRVRNALGGIAHAQADQGVYRRLAQPYYNPKASGGEGHLEVAKAIYYGAQGLVHMVLSLKPFGCLPSTQSDGAQAAVLAQHPEILYLPIETSGEGDINAHSRVQMVLGEAKTRCREEFARCLAETGHTVEDIRTCCEHYPELRRPLQRIPQAKGVAGTAANFVLHAAKRMEARAFTTNSAKNTKRRKRKDNDARA